MDEPWREPWVWATFLISAVVGYLAGGGLRVVTNVIARWLQLSHDPKLEIAPENDSDHEVSMEVHTQWAYLVIENSGYKYGGRKTRAARGAIVVGIVDGGQEEILYFANTEGGRNEERTLIHGMGYIVPLAIMKTSNKPSAYKIDSGKCYITDGDFLIAGARKPLKEGEHTIRISVQWDGGYTEQQFKLIVPSKMGGFTIEKVKNKK